MQGFHGWNMTNKPITATINGIPVFNISEIEIDQAAAPVPLEPEKKPCDAGGRLSLTGCDTRSKRDCTRAEGEREEEEASRPAFAALLAMAATAGKIVALHLMPRQRGPER